MNRNDPIIGKLLRRLMPFTMLLFFISLLDRANISYAALQMNADLHLSQPVYGLAAGIFFIGYVLFEVPSNLIMVKLGARLWLGRIMVSWGVVATAMAWVSGPNSLYGLRFLLGLAEAGLLPGLLYYISQWVPDRARGSVFSVLMATTAIAYVIGGPLSTGLMTLDGLFGFRGWQLMFIAEGIPAVLVGIVVVITLTETPDQARWLTAAEKSTIKEAHAQKLAAMAKAGATSARFGLTSFPVWVAAIFTFFLICDNFGTVFWLPQIIKGFGGLSNMDVGLLSIVPYSLGGIAMVAWGRHSDRSNDRKWHLVGSAALTTIGYACAALATSPIWSFIAICFAAMGIWSTFGIIWAYTGDLVAGPAAATGYALVNSVGTLGGFVGPFLIGYVRAHAQSFSTGLLTLSGFGLLTALIGLLLKTHPGPDLATANTATATQLEH